MELAALAQILSEKMLRRTSSTAMLDSALNVEHNEKHKQPPEDGGATLNLHVFGEVAAHFLQTCLLCKRSLGLGTDIYMYRGDSAFCSAECRHEQILIDEKCSVEVRKRKESSVGGNHRQSSATHQNVQAGTLTAA